MLRKELVFVGITRSLNGKVAWLAFVICRNMLIHNVHWRNLPDVMLFFFVHFISAHPSTALSLSSGPEIRQPRCPPQKS